MLKLTTGLERRGREGEEEEGEGAGKGRERRGGERRERRRKIEQGEEINRVQPPNYTARHRVRRKEKTYRDRER